MTETVLISSFYSFKPFVPAAYKFSPSKIFLVIAEDSLERIDVKEGISKVKEIYGKLASIEIVKVKGAELLFVAKKIITLLEDNKEKKVIVNVSGGWKLLAQGVIYGCYARPDYVEKIVCNNIENDSVVELPKLSFGLSSAKKELLEKLEKRNGKSISDIAKKLDRTRGMIYQHLKELKENGYVDEKFEITDAGRLALL